MNANYTTLFKRFSCLRHANIRKALQCVFKTGLLDTNPTDRIEHPRKEKFVGSFYNEHELEQLFGVVKGDPIEYRKSPETPILLGFPGFGMWCRWPDSNRHG